MDKDFGTGVLKISPGHDHNDYLLARKLGLPILNVMNKDATLNEVAGLYWCVARCTFGTSKNYFLSIIFSFVNIRYLSY